MDALRQSERRRRHAALDRAEGPEWRRGWQRIYQQPLEPRPAGRGGKAPQLRRQQFEGPIFRPPEGAHHPLGGDALAALREDRPPPAAMDRALEQGGAGLAVPAAYPSLTSPLRRR